MIGNVKSATVSTLKTSVSNLPSPKEPKSAKVLFHNNNKQTKLGSNEPLHSKPKNGPIKPKINIDSSRLLSNDYDQERVLFEEDERSVRSTTGEAKESSHIKTVHSDNEHKRKTPLDMKHEENLMIKSQFFAQREIQNEENDNFELAYGMEEEEADFEECESEEIEDSQRRDLKAVRFENEEKQSFNDVEIETRPIMMNKVKRIAIPKFAHELSHQKVYDKISFGTLLSF